MDKTTEQGITPTPATNTFGHAYGDWVQTDTAADSLDEFIAGALGIPAEHVGVIALVMIDAVDPSEVYILGNVPAEDIPLVLAQGLLMTT
jgi:hypothetical protein